MKIYTINTYKDLCEHKDIWLKALDNHKGEKHPFLDFDWVSTYCKHFLKDKKLCVTVCCHDDKIAILPFYYVYKGYRELNCIGKGLSDYTDIITNHNDLSWLKDVLIYNKVDSVKLFNVRDNSPLLSGEKRTIFNNSNRYTVVVEDSVKSPYLDLSSQNWNDYFNGLDKKFRSDILRQIKRLTSLGKVRFECCKDVNRLPRILNIMYNQHIERREDQGQNRSIFLNKRIKDFYHEINKEFFLDSKLLLFYLMFNNNIIAIAECFLYDKNLYYYIPTFDLKFARYSPSKVLLYYIIEYSFKHRLNELDFMIGDEDYKLRWNTEVRRTHNISLFRNNILGKIAFLNSKAYSLCKKIVGKLASSRLKNTKQAMFKVFYKVR